LNRVAGAWAVAIALLFGPVASVAAQAAFHVADGRGDDWQGEDVVGVSVYPAATAAPLDLLSVSAADNGTHWFFRFSYGLRTSANVSIALYLFGAEGGQPAPAEPRGHPFSLPGGAALLYVIYIDLTPAFPAGSSLVFFDGVSWKNRTLGELGIEAARNDTDGFIEISAPRNSLIFLSAGTLAVALFDSASGVLYDSVPDDEPHPVPALHARVAFYDYALQPPIVFSALGFSDPGAVEGQKIQIFLELTNTGPKTAYGISAQVAIDGTTLGSREGLNLLGNNGTAVLSFEWVAVAGPRNVTAKSFPGGASRTLTAIIPGAQAVLSINATQVEPATPAPGQMFLVRVTVYNAGNGPSSQGEVLLKDGTKVIARAPLAPVGAGQSTVVGLSASLATEGPQILHVEIDGVNAANASAAVEVPVTAAGGPLGVPAWAIMVAGIVAIGLGTWFLTPRLMPAQPPRRPRG
jgi:hypothetical protein